MKRLLLICMVLCCTLGWAQKSVVWDNPSQFNENIGFWANISKVELKSDETVLHFVMEYRGRIIFAKESRLITPDGKAYKIIDGRPTTKEERTMDLDEWLDIDEDGAVKFALHFMPLPLDTKSFDFMETENINDGFRVWNIQKERTPRVLPEDWKNINYAENESLPEYKIERKSATIKVKVLGYQPGITLPLHVENFMRLMDEDYFEKEYFFNAETGECIAEVPIVMPHKVQIRIDRIATTQIILAPGETVEILMDMYETGNKILAFKGFMARTNMDLCTKAKEVNNSYEVEAMRSALKCTTSNERLNSIWGALDGQKEKINALNITDATKALLRMEAEEYTQSAINNFLRYYIIEILMANGEVERSQEGFEAAFKKYDSMMPSQERAFFIHDKLETAECTNANYAPYSIKFEENYSNVETETSTSLNSDIYRSMLAIRGELDTFIRMGFFTPEMGIIHDPICKEIVDEAKAIKEAQKKLLESMDNVHANAMNTVAPEDFIPTLLKKYEGKVVLFDVWATWCGPCLMGHKMMVPVKEELKDKDIVYVYLSVPSSNKNTWEKMILEITGEHYLINNQQANYIMNLWESQGIPTYAIYDKKGEHKIHITGFPGPDNMKAELIKALGE